MEAISEDKVENKDVPDQTIEVKISHLERKWLENLAEVNKTKPLCNKKDVTEKESIAEVHKSRILNEYICPQIII